MAPAREQPPVPRDFGEAAPESPPAELARKSEREEAQKTARAPLQDAASMAPAAPPAPAPAAAAAPRRSAGPALAAPPAWGRIEVEAAGRSAGVTRDDAPALAGLLDRILRRPVAPEAQERQQHFAPFQVNRALVQKAPKGAWIMHDLPAHRGEEITDEVMDSPESIIFDQSENRLHLQKGLMVFLDRESAR